MSAAGRLGSLLVLLTPVAMIAVWHFWSIHLYGTSHVFGAADYARNFSGFGLDRLYAVLSFLGASLLWPLVLVIATLPLKRRRLSGNSGDAPSGCAPLNWKAIAAAASVGLVVALVITWADFSWANHYRETARRLLARYGTEGRRIYFEGHWGFKYYMMNGGAIPFDQNPEKIASTRDDTLVIRGMRASDVLVIPMNNYRLWLLGLDKWYPLEVTRDPHTSPSC